MAHGVTNLMRNIRRTIPQERFDIANGPSREDRRHQRMLQNTQVIVRRPGRTFATGGRYWPKDLQQPAVNVPYVNPARDLKRGRRLKVAAGN